MLEQTPQTPARSFVSGVASVIAGQIACALIGLAAEIGYARLLGPEGRGQLSFCLMLIYFGVLLAGMGGEGTITLWRADPSRNAKPWFPAVLFWGVLGCALTCGLGALAYWFWHPAFLRGLAANLAAIVILSIPVSVLFDYQLAMLVGEERFGTRAIAATVSQMAGLAGFAVLLLVRRSSEMALWANLFGVVVGILVTSSRVSQSFRNFWQLPAARENLFSTLSFALRGQFGLVASFFNYRLDVFIVNYFLDSARLGLYALGVVIAEALWQIPVAAAVALFPRTARTVNEGAEDFTCRIVRQVTLIATTGAVAIAFAAWLFVPTVFGSPFRPSIAVVWLLLPGTLGLSLGRVAASDLSGRGHSGYSSVFSIVSLAVTVALDLILIPRFGINGAAMASSTAYLTNTVLLLSALKYEIKVTWRSLLVPTRTEWAAFPRALLHLRERMPAWPFLPGGRVESGAAQANSVEPR